MVTLFELITITVIWCMGVKILTAEGMVLERVGNWAEKKVDEGKIIYEPLLVCEWCLPSIHTAVGIGFAFGIGVIDSVTWNILFYYPIVAMASSLINGLIWQFYKLQNTKKEMYESITDACDVTKDYSSEDEEFEDEQHFFDYENFSN